MSSERDYLSGVHDYYLVCVLDRGCALRDNYLGRLRDVLLESGSYLGVGLGVYRAGGVVENEYLRLFEQRSCYAKTLFLSARDVGSSLLYVGVVLRGKVSTNSSAQASLHASTISSSVAFSSPQRRFFLDSSREEKVLLQNYRDVVSQGIEVIAPYVHSSYLYHALGGVVKP